MLNLYEFEKQMQQLRAYKTPEKKAQKLTFVENVNRYKTNFTPIINAQNRKQLQAKLTIQKESTAATGQRLLNNNYYISYDNNPFTNLKDKRHKFSNRNFYSNKKLSNQPKSKTPTKNKININVAGQQQNDNITPKSANIVQAMNDFVSPKSKLLMQRRHRNFQKINKLLSQSKKISNIITKDFGRNTQQRNLQNSPIPEPRRKYKQVIGMTDEQKKQLKQLKIQDIVSMHDTNFYLNQGRRKINIFKCMHDDEILSPTQQLDQRKFAFNAVIERINKSNNIHLPVYRDISRMSRQIYMNRFNRTKQIVDTLTNQQLIVNYNQLKYTNLMTLASGRFNHQVIDFLNDQYMLHSTAPPNKQYSDASSEQEFDPQIQYDKLNTKNYMLNFHGVEEDRKQIVQFENVELTRRQQQHKLKCEELKTKIKVLLQKKKDLLQNSIQDVQLLTNHQGKIQRTLQNYISDQKDRSLKDIAQLVRKNKKSKNRNQSFQMMKLNQTLTIKNQFDSKLKKGFLSVRNNNFSTNSRSNSKSNSKPSTFKLRK